MSLTNCRFYEEKYPEIDSFVMVNVKQVRVASCAALEGQGPFAQCRPMPNLVLDRRNGCLC